MKTFLQYVTEGKFDREVNRGQTLKQRLFQTYIEDAVIRIVYDWEKHKPRALYERGEEDKRLLGMNFGGGTGSVQSAHSFWVQFPNHLRQDGKIYIADLQSDNADNPKFFRVIKGTIREKGSNEVVG